MVGQPKCLMLLAQDSKECYEIYFVNDVVYYDVHSAALDITDLVAMNAIIVICRYSKVHHFMGGETAILKMVYQTSFPE